VRCTYIRCSPYLNTNDSIIIIFVLIIQSLSLLFLYCLPHVAMLTYLSYWFRQVSSGIALWRWQVSWLRCPERCQEEEGHLKVAWGHLSLVTMASHLRYWSLQGQCSSHCVWPIMVILTRIILLEGLRSSVSINGKWHQSDVIGSQMQASFRMFVQTYKFCTMIPNRASFSSSAKSPTGVCKQSMMLRTYHWCYELICHTNMPDIFIQLHPYCA